MFAFVPRRSVRIFTALCALSLAACGDDDETTVAGGNNSEGVGGAGGSTGSKAGSGGKAGAAGKAGSGGKAATAGAGGKASAGAGGGGKSGAGGKAAAGAGGKAATGGTGGAAAGTGAGKAGAGGKAAGGAGAGGAKAGTGGTEAGSGGVPGAGGQGGSGTDEEVATATLVGLTLDGSVVVDGEDAGTVSTEGGTATFTQTATGVTLKVWLTGCEPSLAYPIHIHAGTSCENVAAQGAHWDVPRGEGIPELVCGEDRTITVEYTRANTDPKGAWTVGGDENDVVGHVVVIHSPFDPAVRAACGKIE